MTKVRAVLLRWWYNTPFAVKVNKRKTSGCSGVVALRGEAFC